MGAKDAGSKTGPDYLVLVNKEHRISPDYAGTIELVSEPGYDNEIFWVEKKTLESFRELRETVKKMDMDITLSSGYRSVERQEEIRRSPGRSWREGSHWRNICKIGRRTDNLPRTAPASLISYDIM